MCCDEDGRLVGSLSSSHMIMSQQEPAPEGLVGYAFQSVILSVLVSDLRTSIHTHDEI
jgi:hypothetical protein